MSLPFRGDQCPARGPGLSHMTDASRGNFNCTHCEQPVTLVPPKGVPPTATEAVPLIDVTERLKALGIMGIYTPDPEPEHRWFA